MPSPRGRSMGPEIPYHHHPSPRTSKAEGALPTGMFFCLYFFTNEGHVTFRVVNLNLITHHKYIKQNHYSFLNSRHEIRIVSHAAGFL